MRARVRVRESGGDGRRQRCETANRSECKADCACAPRQWCATHARRARGAPTTNQWATPSRSLTHVRDAHERRLLGVGERDVFGRARAVAGRAEDDVGRGEVQRRHVDRVAVRGRDHVEHRAGRDHVEDARRADIARARDGDDARAGAEELRAGEEWARGVCVVRTWRRGRRAAVRAPRRGRRRPARPTAENCRTRATARRRTSAHAICVVDSSAARATGTVTKVGATPAGTPSGAAGGA